MDPIKTPKTKTVRELTAKVSIDRRAFIPAAVAVALVALLLWLSPAQSQTLSLADRSAINAARFELAEAMLIWQQLQPQLQQLQQARARLGTAQTVLTTLEADLSMKYTKGELVLNRELEFVPRPEPEQPAPVPAEAPPNEEETP